MTPEQVDDRTHLATKADVAMLQAELHKEIGGLVKWMVALQIPTWTGIVGLLLVLLTHK